MRSWCVIDVQLRSNLANLGKELNLLCTSGIYVMTIVEFKVRSESSRRGGGVGRNRSRDDNRPNLPTLAWQGKIVAVNDIPLINTDLWSLDLVVYLLHIF